MDLTKESLMKMYSFLDDMMADTLIKAYEGGYLEKYLKEEEKERKEESYVIKGAVKVE